MKPEHEPEVLAAKKLKPVRVYMAGPVVDDKSTAGWPRTGMGPSDDACEMVNSWRDFVFDSKHGDHMPGKKSGRFIYAGPTISTMGHGMVDRSEKDLHLAGRCLAQLKQCDIVFAWVDREATVGTIVEITFARAIGVPVYIAFKTDQLAQYFYFAAQIVNKWEIAPSAGEAWKLFKLYLQSIE